MYKSYADVLESHIIAEEGFGDKMAAKKENKIKMDNLKQKIDSLKDKQDLINHRISSEKDPQKREELKAQWKEGHEKLKSLTDEYNDLVR